MRFRRAACGSIEWVGYRIELVAVRSDLKHSFRTLFYFSFRVLTVTATARVRAVRQVIISSGPFCSWVDGQMERVRGPSWQQINLITFRGRHKREYRS